VPASAVPSPLPSSQRGPRLLLAGFVAGALGVLLFHQPLLALLTQAGLANATPYATRPAALTGVPQIVSTSFWGGLWGVVFALVLPRFGGAARRLAAGLVLGALLPSLVAWFVVQPLRGLPPGNGWKPQSIATALSVNGAWGLGTAIVLALVAGPRRRVAARAGAATPGGASVR